MAAFDLILTRNGIFNITLWCIAFYFFNFELSKSVWLLLPLGCTLLNDIVKYQVLPTGIKLPYFLDDNEITQHSYSWMTTATGDAYGEGLDLGFNYYDGDYNKSKEQAQLDKFEHAFKLLKLKPGARVMDVGCGFGDWLLWLKTEKGCHVMGINITKEHAKVVEQRGMECVATKWQNVLAKIDTEYAHLKGQFDCVTFWDTIEHYVKGINVNDHAYVRKMYANVFELANALIDEETEVGTVWSSTLHILKSYTRNPFTLQFWHDWFNLYIMAVQYAGLYPSADKGKSLAYQCRSYFNLIHREDRIDDYRMTSLLNEYHFGNFKLNTGSLGFWGDQLFHLLVTPHYIPCLLDNVREVPSWMWHIGGIGKDVDQKCYAALYWDVYELKSFNSKSLSLWKNYEDITDPWE